jgi:hypothetical protein
MKIFACAAIAGAALALAGSAAAGTTIINLGQSSQDYILFGQGPVSPGVGSFTNAQGSESYDSGTNTTTDTLSGLISSSTDPGLSSGNYSFVTTYLGMPIGSGGTQVQSQSNPSDLAFFFYDFLDPSVDMTLFLTGTPEGSLSIPLVTNGAFDGPGFSFLYVTATCTGVSVCTQNNVGLTPGATQFGPVTITVSLTSVPEPASWALMLIGVAALGGALRARRSGVVTAV